MSLELVRESIKVNQVMGQDITKSIVENDIIVPDVKPDVTNILVLDGDVTINSSEVMQDKTLVGGTIRYKIIYVSDDPDQPVKSINTSVNFSCGLNIPNTAYGMKCMAKGSIEHIDYDILNGRKVNVKTILSISVKAVEEVQYDISNDVKGLDNIQVLKDKVDINSYLGDNEASYTAKEALEVPSGKPTIIEILRNDIKITGRDYKIDDGKIIAKGEMSISTLYIGDDEERSIQYMEHEIPFTQVLDVADVSDESHCQLDYRILDYQFEAGEDNDGELRVVNSDVVLGIYASAYQKKSVEMVTDAYSPNARVSLEKSQITIEELVTEGRGQINLKESIILDDGSPEIGQIFNVISTPILSEVRVADDKVYVEGLTNNKVIYLAANNNQPISCTEQEVPFKHCFDIKGIKENMACEAALDIDHCTYSMISSTQVEIRVVVSVSTKIMGQMVLPVISRAMDAPLDDKRIVNAPSITIYFVQPEDTLWKIAKKYYTTVSDLVKINNISDRDAVAIGQQIIIPRKSY